MKKITKRELNEQTARVLAGIHPGETLLITERGVARWRIETAGANVDPAARLRAEGRITPPSAHQMPWPEDEEARYTPADVDALYAEMREDH